MAREPEYSTLTKDKLLIAQRIARGIKLMELFDFSARQVTTFCVSNEYGDFSGNDSATGVNKQNFRDVEGQESLKQAWDKLKELGGHPPELDLDDKKPQSIGPKKDQRNL